MWFFLLWYTVIPLGQAGTLFNGGANLELERLSMSGGIMAKAAWDLFPAAS